ncbi:MAG: hypothetical protein OI74_09010 [Gammaproteobacteria bacterium (ex Lamellibrachia satsuma)]|nr:MAG: sensor histidine kinase [Gammaproteobacteria bacterium (ex Lamellibrachia satsuma)]RRS33209.1 MAG: hypothetical protein OI74_09010 [Gammaproteobacteria bacterium (ex Lamellibrachia satsuma)]RRS36354.1 MAG: hypothetical protein NV67_07800 [Gammaproteobacteria bacterium (ex Lamellibrachia satsuma)]
MNSLERRLQIGLGLSLVLLIGALWVVGNQSVRGLTEDFVASRLEHDAESLLAALVLDSDRTKLRWRRLNQVYSQPLSGHYYIVRLGEGNVFTSRSLWDHVLDIPTLSPGDAARLYKVGPAGQKLLILVKGFHKYGIDITLAVAEDMSPIQARRDRFKLGFALLAFVGLLLLLLVQRLVVRRSFHSLEAVRDDVRSLEQGKTVKLSENVPLEILPLVQEFNHLLSLLTQRMERSRNAVGNLAHALKGPLNLLTRYFDVSEGREQTPQNDQAWAQIERIRSLMERELKRARLAGKGVSGQHFNPHLELADLAKTLQLIHQDRALDIQLQADDDIPVFGDREDMFELLGNLLDNACKWAESRVVCRMTLDGGVHMVIEDDGPGLTEQEFAGLTRRGVRLDETVEGHGLGVSIARDIVKLYEGTILFRRSPELGGVRVEVVLPLETS